jgi:hypothetical protein
MSVPPSKRAFVVKVSAGADSAHIAGRVEHVTSGTSARFEAIEQLGTFIIETLSREADAADARQRDAD